MICWVGVSSPPPDEAAPEFPAWEVPPPPPPQAARDRVREAESNSASARFIVVPPSVFCIKWSLRTGGPLVNLLYPAFQQKSRGQICAFLLFPAFFVKHNEK